MGARPRPRHPAENGPKDAGMPRRPVLESRHTHESGTFLLSPPPYCAWRAGLLSSNNARLRAFAGGSSLPFRREDGF
jgi:hypothetical protein